METFKLASLPLHVTTVFYTYSIRGGAQESNTWLDYRLAAVSNLLRLYVAEVEGREMNQLMDFSLQATVQRHAAQSRSHRAWHSGPCQLDNASLSINARPHVTSHQPRTHMNTEFKGCFLR
eukprot:4649784-Pyramimonas_sp.AAC.3